MWPNTQLTEILNIALPLIQAPMAGGATTPELIAAVANAGGLGSLGAGYLSPAMLKSAILAIRKLTNKPFAVNLFITEPAKASMDEITRAAEIIQKSCPELNLPLPSIQPPYAPSFDEQLNIFLEMQIPILSFTFGIPAEEYLKKLKKNHVCLMGTATNLAEALLLESQGIDIVVAQGSEAGGHRGTFIGQVEDALIPTTELTSLLAQHLKIPVIASGGIMQAEQVITMLKHGAAGVQMGTAFLTCVESGIPALYKKTLLNLEKDITTLTKVFSGKMARGINNRFIERMQKQAENILPYPIQNALTQTMRQASLKQDTPEFIAMWAGQNAYLCQDISVENLIKEINSYILR